MNRVLTQEVYEVLQYLHTEHIGHIIQQFCKQICLEQTIDIPFLLVQREFSNNVPSSLCKDLCSQIFTSA